MINSDISILIDRKEALCREVDLILTPSSRSDKPVIAACGLVNAGKSYLLNMLTEHIDDEFFPVADQRETARIQSLEMNTYIYIDTPGLDASDEDTGEATTGIDQADIVLFVHQPQGELEENEKEFLYRLKQAFGDFAEQNIVLVLSKTDKEGQEKIDEIANKVQQQCLEFLEFSPKIFKVSGQRFKSGTQQHKDGLIRHSHINDLASHIKMIADDSVKTREIRTIQAIDTLLEKIKQAEAGLAHLRVTAQKELHENFAPFNQLIDTLRSTIETFEAQYKNI